MTPQEKCDLIREKSNRALPVLFERAKLLLKDTAAFDKRAHKLFRIIDEMAGHVAEVALCKKNCSFCCYQAVLISEWEAKQIAKYTKRKMIDIAGYGSADDDTPESLRDKYNNLPCTFLHDGDCSIYPMRPAICRLHFSMANEISLCDIVGDPGATVPYFDFEQTKILTMCLMMQYSTKFGDIREFFALK